MDYFAAANWSGYDYGVNFLMLSFDGEAEDENYCIEYFYIGYTLARILGSSLACQDSVKESCYLYWSLLALQPEPVHEAKQES